MTKNKQQIRTGLIWLIAISLTLTISRQVLDFMGHMWLPIMINFLQIIFLIFGLFGSIQYRISFVGAFCGWCLIWIGWNCFLMCLYLSLGSLDRKNAPSILGFGTEGSKSFWIDHTPLCDMEYNLTQKVWIEKSCYFGYQYIETVIAVLHAKIGLLAFIFSLVFLIKLSRKSGRGGLYGTSPRNRQPRITVEFSDPPPPSSHLNGHLTNGRVSHDPAPPHGGYHSDAYDASSGYLNTSFEPGSPSPPTKKQNGFVPSLDKNGVLVQKYRNPNSRRSSSKKRRKRSQEQQEIVHSNRVGSPTDDEPSMDFISHRRNEVMDYEHEQGTVDEYGRQRVREDDYSVATTAEYAEGHRIPPNPGGRHRGGRSHSSTRTTREERERRKARRTRSVSPPLGRRDRALHHSEITLESRIQSPDSGIPPSAATLTTNADSERLYRPRSQSVKHKPYKHYAAGHLHRFGSQDSSLVAMRLAAGDESGPQVSQRQYTNEPRRLSVTEPRGIRNSNDSVLNGGAGTPHQQSKSSNNLNQSPEKLLINPPLTSLVSFDPKSNTLIRYHDHLARSREIINPVDSSQGTDETDSNIPLHLQTNYDHYSSQPSPNGYSGNNFRPQTSNGPQHYHNPQRTNRHFYPDKLDSAPHSDRISYDSGHPPSSSSIVHNHEWSSQGSNGSSELQNQPKSAKGLIGYEPAISGPPPTYSHYHQPPVAQMSREPIYKPNYISSQQKISQSAAYRQPQFPTHLHGQDLPNTATPFQHSELRNNNNPIFTSESPSIPQRTPQQPHLAPKLMPVRDGVLMAFDNDNYYPAPDSEQPVLTNKNSQFLPSLSAQLAQERKQQETERQPPSRERIPSEDYRYLPPVVDSIGYARPPLPPPSEPHRPPSDAPVMNNNSILV